MQKQAFIVTGLGYGDEGKGSVVDWLTHRHSAHTVIRTGGPQALHRVVASDGREHVFQQFGSGTLRGAGTHLSKHMLVAPHAFLRELDTLQDKCHHNILVNTSVHRDALIVTPFQAITGRIRELLRGKNRRGTVGVGVGETVRDSETVPDLVLHASDLYCSQLPEKLANLSRYTYEVARNSLAQVDAKLVSEDAVSVIFQQVKQLTDHRTLLSDTIQQYRHFAGCVQLVDDQYVAKHILGRDGTVVIEGSQGVLLDRVHGFYPYTTKVRATPETGRHILTDGHYDGKVTSLGIVRSYATKHGRGPFMTEDATLTKQLPDAANKDDPWQTKFRVGHFDAVATRYAVTACGAGAIDGLVVTCLDRTATLSTWSVCTAYQFKAMSLPNSNGGLVDQTKDLFDLPQHTKGNLSNFLSDCHPVLQHHKKNKAFPQTKQVSQAMEIQHQAGVRVYAISAGETEQDKFIIKHPDLPAFVKI